MVQEALQQVATLAAEKQVALRSDLGADQVSADEEKLVRTLVNLLANAIKFTPTGGTVSLSVGQDEPEKALRFRVTDTGEGIPAEAFDSIVETFGQVQG